MDPRTSHCSNRSLSRWRGEPRCISFYRDRHGAEIDLVVDEPDVLTIVEAKSAATPKSSLLEGATRVRPRLLNVRPRCDLTIVYGGEERQERSDSRLTPWRLVRSVAPPRVDPLVQVFTEGGPVANADVLALFPDRTSQSAKTDERGRATLKMLPRHLPMTVFVARDGFAAHVEPGRVPDEHALHVRLRARPGGGSLIAPGAVPGMPVEVIVKGKAMTVRVGQLKMGILK